MNSYRQKNQTGLLSHNHVKNKLKIDERLTLRPQTIKLLEENRGERLLDVAFGNEILDMTAKAQITKAKISKWDYTK